MYAIGIDLGGHKISAAVIKLGPDSASIVSRMDITTPANRKLDDVTDCIVKLVLKLHEVSPVAALGIGVPGFLDSSRSTVRCLTNFHCLENIEFPSFLKRTLEVRGFPLEVFMENDANCAALGEGLYGMASGCSDYIVLTLGTGIGSGIVLNGKLLAGSHGMAGESGHIAISNTRNTCMCGGISHLESFASADAIECRARKAGLPEDFKSLWERRNEEKINEILELGLDSLAKGIASVIVTIDPEVVILNGGMSRAEGIADELTQRILPYLPVPFRPYLNIKISRLGGEAAILGAASLCLR